MGILTRRRGGRGASSSGDHWPTEESGAFASLGGGCTLGVLTCAHLRSPHGAHRRGDGGVKIVLSRKGTLYRSEKAKSSTRYDMDES